MSTSSTSLPLLHHQYIAMVYVYQRIFIYSMICPITVIIIPILLRIIYQFLTLCVIGGSKRENGNTDDTLVITAVTMTILFTHILTTQFLNLQSYLHSFSLHSKLEQQNHSTLSSSATNTDDQTNHKDNIGHDDDDDIKINKIDNKMSKENSQMNHDMNDTTVQENNLTTDNSNSSKVPLTVEQNSHENHSTNNVTTTKKHDTTSEQEIPTKNSLNDAKATLNTNKHDHKMNSTRSNSNSLMTTMYISIVVFILICILIRYLRNNHYLYLYRFIIPYWNISNNNNIHNLNNNSNQNLPNYLLPSFMTTVRLSLCMVICSLMMALRFFGPASIVRLSIVPLVSNPWDRAVTNWFYDLRNTVIHHCYPIISDRQTPPPNNPRVSTPIVQPQWSTQYDALVGGDKPINCVGRRYERPNMYATMQQIVIALMASLSIAYIDFSPQFLVTTMSHDSENMQLYTKYTHMGSCIFTALGTVITILDGVSHEINPYLYTNPNKTIWFHTVSTNIITRVLITTMLVPIASMIIAAYKMKWHVGLSFKNHLQLYWIILRSCAGMALYLYTYDEMIRTSLFHPRPNVSKMIRQWSNDLSSSTVTQLGVILNSLVGDPSIVQEILNVSYSMTRVGAWSFEKEEIISLDKHARQMAHVLLSPIYNYALLETPLEEDVLRIVILEAFGGGGGDRSQLLTMSARHQRLISAWIDRPIPRSQSKKLMTNCKPLSSALVRGLCVYIGGSGEVFTMLSSPMSSLMEQQQAFKFSPAAFCSLELCVVAIGRCIARSLTTSSGRLLSDWKCSHLSIQIPSALVAIYKLRSGAVEFSKVVNQDCTNRSIDVTGNTFVGVHLVKEYGLLVHTCDSVASLIVLSMKSLQGLGRMDDTLFDRDCLEWKNQLTELFAEDDIRK